MYDLLNRLKEELENENDETYNLSLKDCHVPGLFSLVVQGKPGRLLRVFIAKNTIIPFEAQFHTHKYPITITPLYGNIVNHVAKEIPYSMNDDPNVVRMNKFKYSSALTGKGNIDRINSTLVTLSESNIPIGASLSMTSNSIHTVSCTKGSMWVVEEEGIERDHSFFLGAPFTTDGLYDTPNIYDIKHMSNMVLIRVKYLLNLFEPYYI